MLTGPHSFSVPATVRASVRILTPQLFSEARALARKLYQLRELHRRQVAQRPMRPVVVVVTAIRFGRNLRLLLVTGQFEKNG